MLVARLLCAGSAALFVATSILAANDSMAATSTAVSTGFGATALAVVALLPTRILSTLKARSTRTRIVSALVLVLATVATANLAFSQDRDWMICLSVSIGVLTCAVITLNQSSGKSSSYAPHVDC